ncbi:hypothetical protein R4227_01555 [Gordonia amicalis]|uniref:hypothetical protein n=1 Tax=Gordonia amicalis TaxID=89053 RepID=UPI0029557C62|nr:hypothetical protein [Gordonia amicalis]MDV7098857.1 hypothetical protein [Gordonia amicalis]
MNRPLTTLTFAVATAAAGLIGGAALASAEPCTMTVGDGRTAPCPPPVISTGPEDNGAVSDTPETAPLSEPPPFYDYPYDFYELEEIGWLGPFLP